MVKGKIERDGWIRSFSGLRFLLVICLIFHHFDMFNDLNLPGWDRVMKFLGEGYLSVNFFFILSGFSVEHGYGRRMRGGLVSKKDFMVGRLAHLWPTYLLCLFAALFFYGGWTYALTHLRGGNFWIHFFMLQSWLADGARMYSFNGAAWSVSTELFFYIAFCFLFDLDARRRNFLTVGLWAVILLNVVIVGVNLPTANWLYYINPVFRLGDFLLGIWLHDIYLRRKEITFSRATCLEVGSCVLVAAAALLVANLNFGWEWRWQVWYTVPCALLIYAFSFDAGGISKILGTKPFQFLGKISFPLYLVHQICLWWVKQRLAGCIDSWQIALLAGICGLVLSIVVAIAVEFLFTEPLNNLIRKKWKDRMARRSKEGTV